jgi:hypothetical protein
MTTSEPHLAHPNPLTRLNLRAHQWFISAFSINSARFRPNKRNPNPSEPNRTLAKK